MLPWLIKKHLKAKPFMRGLTKGEIALANTVFGGLIDYARVQIVQYPYVPWQTDEVLIAPNGFIFVHGRHYRDDFSSAGAMYERLFIHEMTHVLQYQQGICVLWHGAWLQSAYYLSGFRYNPYRYTFDENKNFWQYNIEQQGSICEDIWLGKIPNIVSPKQSKVVCPHDNCRQALVWVDCHQGINFCPHCQQSVLNQSSTSVGFIGFMGQMCARYGRWYLALALVWVLIWWLLTAGAGQTLAIVVAVLALAGVLGLFIWLDIKQRTFVHQKHISTAISQGVDSLTQVKDDDNIGMALEALTKMFGFVPPCPHCHSQRLHKDLYNHHYHCQNCQHTLMPNRCVSVLSNLAWVLYVLILAVLSLFISDVWVVGWLMLVLAIIIHFVSAYWHFSIPKWQQQ